MDEEAPLRPVSLYAELKVKFERYLLERSTPVDFTMLRFATVYGLSLRPRFDLTVNEFARDALLKGELEIYGPQFWRPYCHVSDIARAIVLVLETPSELVAGKTFNVGSNDENYQKRNDRRRGRTADPGEGDHRRADRGPARLPGQLRPHRGARASSRACASPTASARSPAPSATASSPIPTRSATGTPEVPDR